MTVKNPPARLRRIVKEYLDQTHERFPESASRLGLREFEGRLGVNDASAYKAQVALAERMLTEVEALPGSAFAGDDWLDRRFFLSMLRCELLTLRDLGRHRDNPQIHANSAVDSIFDLVIRNQANLGGVLPAVEARLEKLPDYLAAGASCVRRPVPLWTGLAQQACQGALEFLEGLVEPLSGVSNDPSRTQDLLQGAGRAFRAYAEAIGRKEPGDPRGYSLGRERFEFLMRERLGMDCSLAEALAEGQQLVGALSAEVDAEARRLGARSARAALEEAAEAWTPSRPLLDLYRETTTALRNKTAALGLATFPPTESLEVLQAPPFLRHQFPTAAYSAPPPFAHRQVGIFWVNDLSLHVTSPARRHAEIRQHFGLELTTAHEAYPGHHLQFAIQNRHPSRLRRLADHSIFYEGWTMWCEKLAVEHGLIEHPTARLLQLHDALWRAYRIVIDCGLGSGELTHEGALRILMRGVGFTRARARGDVNWYTSAPTVPMSYLLGRLEVERLHAQRVTSGGMSLREFNDWMLSHGAIPWSWIERAWRYAPN